MSAKIAKIDLFLLVRKAFSLRQTPVRADAIENLRNMKMASAISLQDYQDTKTCFETMGLAKGMPPEIKMWQKAYGYFSFSFF